MWGQETKVPRLRDTARFARRPAPLGMTSRRGRTRRPPPMVLAAPNENPHFSRKERARNGAPAGRGALAISYERRWVRVGV